MLPKNTIELKKLLKTIKDKELYNEIKKCFYFTMYEQKINTTGNLKSYFDFINKDFYNSRSRNKQIEENLDENIIFEKTLMEFGNYVVEEQIKNIYKTKKLKDGLNIQKEYFILEEFPYLNNENIFDKHYVDNRFKDLIKQKPMTLTIEQQEKLKNVVIGCYYFNNKEKLIQKIEKEQRKTLKITVYSYDGKEVSLNSKRLYTNCIFYITCPKCEKENVYKPRTYSFIYNPLKNKKINFECKYCNYENYSYEVQEIKDGYAVIEQNPVFKKIIIEN